MELPHAYYTCLSSLSVCLLFPSGLDRIRHGSNGSLQPLTVLALTTIYYFVLFTRHFDFFP